MHQPSLQMYVRYVLKQPGDHVLQDALKVWIYALVLCVWVEDVFEKDSV